MAKPPEDETRKHERKLWAELNRRLQAAVPEGTTDAESPVAMAGVIMEDPQIKRLFDRVTTTALYGDGFLHERLKERNHPPSVFSVLCVDDKCEPIDIGIEDAFTVFVESAYERVQISLMDIAGEGFALVSGSLLGFPDAVERDGERYGELTVGREGMVAAIRIPDHPGSRCMMTPDGTVTGKLPGGACWSVFYPDSKRN